MKNISYLFITVFLLSCNQNASMSERSEPIPQYYLVGSYTQTEEHGIYLLRLDAGNGEITSIDLAVPSVNPSFLSLAGNHLLAVNELNGRDGTVTSYYIDNRILRLFPVDTISAKGIAPCFIETNPRGTSGVVANYGTGNVIQFGIESDGTFSEQVREEQHSGSGPNAGRQEGPHAHSIRYHPSKPLIFAADLGIDAIKVYDLQLNEYSEIPLAAGSGPRHIEFNEAGDLMYVINELNSTISVIQILSGTEFKELQTISTLPDGFSGENYCADIHLDSSGKYLLGSNRGHDSIVSFAIDGEGLLSDAQWVTEEVNWPRNFALTPDGNWLLVANQKSNSISVFSYKDGKATFRSKSEVHAPVCIVQKP